MKFEDAYKIMKKEKKKIKLPDWNDVYWFIHDSNIAIYTNGKIHSLKESIDFTLKNLFRTDWQVID